MATTPSKAKAASTEAVKQITYLAGALKLLGSLRPPPGWPTRPAMPAGPTRTTSQRSSNAKSAPATPQVHNYGSAPPGSVV